MELSGMGKMAWRNLWRNRRRTLITLSSISLAVALSVIGTGMNDRIWRDVIDLAARMGGGHVTIQHPDYEEEPNLTHTIQDAEKAAALAQMDDSGARATIRITGQTLLSTASDSFGAGFIAYDPAREDAQTLSVLDAVESGAILAFSDQRGILLGAKLARNLGARLGSKVVYTMTNKRGEIVHGLARVSGIIKTGSPSTDLGLCLLPIGVTRKDLGYQPTEATQVAVFLRDSRRSGEVAQRLAQGLEDGAVALNWQRTQPDLDSMIAMKKGGMVFFEALILLLCAAGIFNTVFVSVMERLREFGIMMAVGLSPWRLFCMVMMECLWLAGLGVAGGAALAVWPYHYLNTVGLDLSGLYGGVKLDVAGIGMSAILKAEIYPENALAVALVVAAATLLSGVYPAWKAGGVNPVETIKLV